ncbi:hypothetical protein Tco_1293401 [Tanacetum coccineum]
MILQDTLQVSLAKHKSREEQEARENVALVMKHLNKNQIFPGTRIEPRSNKESPEVEITKDKEVEITKETLAVEITNVIIPVNVNDDDDEITDEGYELKRREKGKLIEETRNSPIPKLIRSHRIQTNLESLISETPRIDGYSSYNNTINFTSQKVSKTNRLLSLFKTKPTRFKRYKSFFHELQGRYGYLFAHLRARFMPRKSFDTLADNLHDVMVETLPAMVDKHIKEQVMKQVPEQVQNQVLVMFAEGSNLDTKQVDTADCNVLPSQLMHRIEVYMSGHILYTISIATTNIVKRLALQMKFERNTIPTNFNVELLPFAQEIRDDPHDEASYLRGENSASGRLTSEYEAYVSGESSSGQVFQEEQAPSTSGNQEQDDDFDFWTDSYASDDDEIPTKQVSQDIMEEVSLTIDEAKLE